MSRHRLGFAGTPAFAARILEALIQDGQNPAVIYTQPDRPVGRGRRMQRSPVGELAARHAIALRQPGSLKSPEAADELADFDLDVLIVAAYGLLLPPSILAVPRIGCINVHASLLPRWRGAAPIERAIMAGDRETGVSIMQMDEGLDTGPVYLSRACTIGAQTTGPELESTLAELGCGALLACLAELPGIVPIPQPTAGATYARKLTMADAAIDWHQSAVLLERQVRALCGRIPAFSFTNGVRVQLLGAVARGDRSDAVPGTVITATARDGLVVACGEGALEISRLQLNRGKGQPMDAAAAINGFSSVLGQGSVFHDQAT